MDSKVLVTGGAGYIGSVFVPQLLEIGYNVTALDNFMYRQNSLLDVCYHPNLNIIVGDARDGERLKAEIKKHDIVIACHSLSMMNIRNALAKMNELCERYACIYAFGGKRVWDFTNLWPRLYGEKFVPGPSYIYLVNLLYYMSINANVEINKRKMERRYGNLDSAMEETKIKLDIRDDKKDGIIRKYLIDTLQEENGELFHVKEFEEVMIWWEK